MTGDKPCPMCAGTGKVDIKETPLEPYAAATSFILDLDALKDLKVICGT